MPIPVPPRLRKPLFFFAFVFVIGCLYIVHPLLIMSSSGTAKKHSLDIKVHDHVPALENATLSVEGTLPGAPGTVDKAPKAVIPLTVQPKLVVCTLIFGRQAWRKPTVQLFISAAGGAGFDVRLIGNPIPTQAGT